MPVPLCILWDNEPKIFQCICYEGSGAHMATSESQDWHCTCYAWLWWIAWWHQAMSSSTASQRLLQQGLVARRPPLKQTPRVKTLECETEACFPTSLDSLMNHDCQILVSRYSGECHMEGTEVSWGSYFKSTLVGGAVSLHFCCCLLWIIGTLNSQRSCLKSKS